MAPACRSACSSKKLHPNCMLFFPSKMRITACSFEKLHTVLKPVYTFNFLTVCKTACSFAKSINYLVNTWLEIDFFSEFSQVNSTLHIKRCPLAIQSCFW